MHGCYVALSSTGATLLPRAATKSQNDLSGSELERWTTDYTDCIATTPLRLLNST